MSGMSNYALFLKLADRLANISDSPKESYLKDTTEMIEYLEQKRIFTKSQLRLVKAIQEVLDEQLSAE